MHSHHSDSTCTLETAEHPAEVHSIRTSAQGAVHLQTQWVPQGTDRRSIWVFLHPAISDWGYRTGSYLGACDSEVGHLPQHAVQNPEIKPTRYNIISPEIWSLLFWCIFHIRSAEYIHWLCQSLRLRKIKFPFLVYLFWNTFLILDLVSLCPYPSLNMFIFLWPWSSLLGSGVIILNNVTIAKNPHHCGSPWRKYFVELLCDGPNYASEYAKCIQYFEVIHILKRYWFMDTWFWVLNLEGQKKFCPKKCNPTAFKVTVTFRCKASARLQMLILIVLPNSRRYVRGKKWCLKILIAAGGIVFPAEHNSDSTMGWLAFKLENTTPQKCSNDPIKKSCRFLKDCPWELNQLAYFSK